jgi:hypothetical protein
MKAEKVIQLAEQCGLGMFIYPPLRLNNMGDRTIRFIKPTEMTPYGKNLVSFANLIEKEVKGGEE